MIRKKFRKNLCEWGKDENFINAKIFIYEWQVNFPIQRTLNASQSFGVECLCMCAGYIQWKSVILLVTSKNIPRASALTKARNKFIFQRTCISHNDTLCGKPGERQRENLDYYSCQFSFLFLRNISLLSACILMMTRMIYICTYITICCHLINSTSLLLRTLQTNFLWQCTASNDTVHSSGK